MPEIFNSTTKESSKTEPVAPNVPSQTSGSSGNSLSAFMFRPRHIKFETQEVGEEIILFLRQHFVVNIGWIFATIVLSLIPVVIIPLLLNSSILPANLPPGYMLVIPLLWYLGVFGYILVNFLQWYFNVYVVTNDRIVDIDWVNLLYKNLSSAKLDRVQDISFKQAGIFDLFFNYGDVLIQTAGAEANFEFDSVPKPDLVVREINELIRNRNNRERRYEPV